MQIFNKLEIIFQLPLPIMRNSIANLMKILGICKDFAGNRVNELGNVPRCGVVPKYSDLEVIALGITAAMTFMQYVNYLNHRPIGQIKYSLI